MITALVNDALISVVIPNLNGIQYLPQCLSSLHCQTLQNIEIIVVDNGSVDGSPVYIKKEFPLVRLIELKENSGFAEGCNIGIRASGGDYVALLNSDTEVEPQWLEELYKSASKNETTGMVCCFAQSSTGVGVITSCRPTGFGGWVTIQTTRNS